MMHMNRYMDHPQSFQGTHFPYPYHYYPTWTPPQTKVETSKSPGMFEPWFHGSGYGFPNPAECHGCCNQSHPFGYYNWKPPHSHLPSPPSFYNHGPYSPYVELHPPHYFPSHYAMEQPRFEIDKSMPKLHFCGCPNHTCNGKEEMGVKIEEHDPEVEKKESGTLSLSPVKNYPHPILWVPPEYLRDRATSKPSESDTKLLNSWFPFDVINDKENSKLSYSRPKVLNRWSPFDVNDIKSSGQDGHKEGMQNRQNEERPYPIIWMPAYNKPEEVEKSDRKESIPSSKDSEEPQRKYTIIPVKFPFNVDHRDGEGLSDTSETEVQSKVKEKGEEKRNLIGQKDEKIISEENKKDPKCVSVKQPQEHGGNKKSSSNENAKRRSPSPSKGTKLPPVCLRLEPLPRRKARSPSPPSLKEKVKEVDGTSKSPSPRDKHHDSTSQEPFCNIENEVKQQEKETKVVKVEESMPGKVVERDSINSCNVGAPITVPVVSSKEVQGETSTEKAEIRGEKNKVQEGATKEPRQEKEVMKEKKCLSSAEAAVRIQSTYRGYEVRKWEPLRKLSQIAKVREQMNEVRNQILDLEASGMQINEKQRVLISETIMNLLLQLDTIQGLFPSLREIRKSVARELVSLQEKLDSVTSEKAEDLTSMVVVEESNIKPSTTNSECMQAESIEESEHLEPDNCVHLTDKPEESAQQILHVPGSGVEETAVESVTDALADSVMQRIPIQELKGEEVVADSFMPHAPIQELKGVEEVVASASEAHADPLMPETQHSDEDPENSEVHVGSVLVEDAKPDLPLNELSTSPPEDNVSYSDIGASGGAVIAEVLGSPRILDKPVSSEGESKAEEFMLPLAQEESGEEKLVEVFKPEEQLVKEVNHVEEHNGVPKMGNSVSSEDVNNLSPKCLGSGAAYQNIDVVEETKEEKSETIAAKNQVPKGKEEGGFTGNLGESISKGSGKKEREGIEDLEEATADKDETMDCFPAIEVLEAKAIDLAPESAQEENGQKDPPLNPKVNSSESEEKNNLVKENEKLRGMLEKLIQAGNDQLNVISDLNGRVKDLEQKLMKDRKLRRRRPRAAARPHKVNKTK